jgi:hypothetical protein
VNPAEDGPVVLQVFCERRRDPHLLADVRLRPSDGHRVLHPNWKRVSAQVIENIEVRIIDLDDEERAAALAVNIAGMVKLRTQEGRANAAKIAAMLAEKPWLFCGCGHNRTITASWLREQAPSQPVCSPRRVGAP